MMILTADVNGTALQFILGPEEYLKAQAFTIAAGTIVEVIGVDGFQVNGTPAMLVRQVKVGDRTLVVRDRTGKPAWPPPAGAGVRQQP